MIAGNRKRAAGCRDFEFLGQALVIDVETKRLGRRVEIGAIDEQRNLVGGRWHPSEDGIQVMTSCGLDDRFHETCVMERMVWWRIPCLRLTDEERDHGRMAASGRIDDDRRND